MSVTSKQGRNLGVRYNAFGSTLHRDRPSVNVWQVALAFGAHLRTSRGNGLCGLAGSPGCCAREDDNQHRNSVAITRASHQCRVIILASVTRRLAHCTHQFPPLLIAYMRAVVCRSYGHTRTRPTASVKLACRSTFKRVREQARARQRTIDFLAHVF